MKARPAILVPWLVALTALGAAACEPSSKPDPAHASLVTMFGLERYFAANPGVATLPGGIPIRGRYTIDPARPPGFSNDVIVGFSEGEPAGYVTTEYWFNAPEVWVQPMYVFVTGRNPDGTWKIADDHWPVFSVGADRPPRAQPSAFYSSFWRIHYVLVAPATQPNTYHSTRQIFADKLPIFPGPASLCTLVPDGAELTAGPVGVPRPHPMIGPFPGDQKPEARVGDVKIASGWVDGDDKPYRVYSFGTDRFTWNEDMVVDEVPLYVAVTKNDAGGFVFTGLPSVLGTGPARSGASWAAPRNKPNFGSLWRVYFLVLPRTAGTVLPADPAHPQAARYTADRLEITTAGLTVKDAPREDPNDPLAVRRYYGRIALDVEKCLPSPGSIDAGTPDDAGTSPDDAGTAAAPGVTTLANSKCTWIDSQKKVLTLLPPGAVVRTEILATCPFVTFASVPVPN